MYLIDWIHELKIFVDCFFKNSSDFRLINAFKFLNEFNLRSVNDLMQRIDKNSETP
jgi:hypothetical protein